MIILRFWIIIQTLHLTRTYSVAPGGGTCTATFCRRSNMWGLLFWKQVKQTFFFLMLLNINYIGWRAMHWHKSSTLFPSPIILKSQFTVDLQQFFPSDFKLCNTLLQRFLFKNKHNAYYCCYNPSSDIQTPLLLLHRTSGGTCSILNYTCSFINFSVFQRRIRLFVVK